MLLQAHSTLFPRESERAGVALRSRNRHPRSASWKGDAPPRSAMREFASVSDSRYSADDVDWLRPPEVEGEAGEWSSRWLLRIQFPTKAMTGEILQGPQHPDLISFELTPLAGDEFRLQLESKVHPLDLVGYPLIDAVLRWVDDRVVVLTINGSERDKWRTFR